MLFNHGGLFSLKYLYQVNFMTIGSPKNPSIWTELHALGLYASGF